MGWGIIGIGLKVALGVVVGGLQLALGRGLVVDRFVC